MMRLKKLKGEWKAEIQVGKEKCTSGISEIDAIAGKVVLELETLGGCSGCNGGGGADEFLSKREGGAMLQ